MNALIKRYPIWVTCLVLIIIVSLYWSLWASSRYVSETNVVLESPQIAAPSLNFQTLLSGGGGGATDMLLLRDYLLSVDMLKKVDDELDFRTHYSADGVDFISSLASPDVTIEELHQYYLKQVSVELDDYAKILRIKVFAFSPDMAHEIAVYMLREGEQHMNIMGQRLAEEQVKFLEAQVEDLNSKFQKSRRELINYQNENGLVSPTATLNNINTVVASLEAKLANLKAKRTAERSYQSQKSSDIRKIDSEIEALIQQIEIESSRMAQSTGEALNEVSAEYQTLELKMTFAHESYSGALAALENTRIESVRKLKQVSVLQSPTLPEYSVSPRRFYNALVFAVMALFLGLIVQMLSMIVKDHRD